MVPRCTIAHVDMGTGEWPTDKDVLTHVQSVTQAVFDALGVTRNRWSILTIRKRDENEHLSMNDRLVGRTVVDIEGRRTHFRVGVTLRRSDESEVCVWFELIATTAHRFAVTAHGVEVDMGNLAALVAPLGLRIEEIDRPGALGLYT